jgi:16S rRNA (cytosine1402-N4)-methyltransferase
MIPDQDKLDKSNSMAGGHVPVMLNEAMDLLNVRADRLYVDATAGAGGHLKKMCEIAGSGKNIIAIDQDIEALERLRSGVQDIQSEIKFVNSNFSAIKTVLSDLNIATVDGGILADLGISSNQLSDSNRGFSFLRDGPIDMRMDLNSSLSAYDLVNELEESELANIIFKYGEERHNRAIAKAIVLNRPINTTLTLANIIESTLTGRGHRGRIANKKHGWGNKIHPATRTFQALRIAVNNELDNLKKFLEQSATILAPGARLVVITFHSLEDRIVKQFFKEMASNCVCPPRQPICTCKRKSEFLIITPKPLRASDDEIFANIRSRSAKLRAVEKLP